jgi:hypothetical protein
MFIQGAYARVLDKNIIKLILYKLFFIIIYIIISSIYINMTTPANTSVFTITSGNCGTSGKILGTLDNCIVIQSQSPSNLERRVALKYFPSLGPSLPQYFQVRFFEDNSNTYKYKKNLVYGGTEGVSPPGTTTIAEIIIFLKGGGGDSQVVVSVDNQMINDLVQNIIKESGIFALGQGQLAAYMTHGRGGGSHKRYRKSRKYRKSHKSIKYQSRKQSRRHIQRRKRTHRHKSQRSRK